MSIKNLQQFQGITEETLIKMPMRLHTTQFQHMSNYQFSNGSSSIVHFPLKTIKFPILLRTTSCEDVEAREYPNKKSLECVTDELEPYTFVPKFIQQHNQLVSEQPLVENVQCVKDSKIILKKNGSNRENFNDPHYGPTFQQSKRDVGKLNRIIELVKENKKIKNSLQSSETQSTVSSSPIKQPNGKLADIVQQAMFKKSISEKQLGNTPKSGAIPSLCLPNENENNECLPLLMIEELSVSNTQQFHTHQVTTPFAKNIYKAFNHSAMNISTPLFSKHSENGGRKPIMDFNDGFQRAKLIIQEIDEISDHSHIQETQNTELKTPHNNIRLKPLFECMRGIKIINGKPMLNNMKTIIQKKPKNTLRKQNLRRNIYYRSMYEKVK